MYLNYPWITVILCNCWQNQMGYGRAGKALRGQLVQISHFQRKQTRPRAGEVICSRSYSKWMTVATRTQVSWFSVQSFKRGQTHTLFISLPPATSLTHYFFSLPHPLLSHLLIPSWQKQWHRQSMEKWIPWIRQETFGRMLMRSIEKLEDSMKNWLKGGREQIQSRKKIKRNPTARTRKSQRKENRNNFLLAIIFLKNSLKCHGSNFMHSVCFKFFLFPNK